MFRNGYSERIAISSEIFHSEKTLFVGEFDGEYSAVRAQGLEPRPEFFGVRSATG
jgi:hypothetical protein